MFSDHLSNCTHSCVYVISGFLLAHQILFVGPSLAMLCCCCFYRDNILVLDVFFEALNYETIEQKKAYEVAGLLGEFRVK